MEPNLDKIQVKAESDTNGKQDLIMSTSTEWSLTPNVKVEAGVCPEELNTGYFKSEFKRDSIGLKRKFVVENYIKKVEPQHINNYEDVSCDSNSADKTEKYADSSITGKRKEFYSTKKQKTFQCETCGGCFPDIHSLTKHKVMHAGQKPFECDTCGESFTLIQNLATHIHTSHSKSEEFKCETCGGKFLNSKDLAKHGLRHTLQKFTKKCTTTTYSDNNYTCHVCRKSFKNSSWLKRHMWTHEREKLFKCDLCGLSFQSPTNLSGHKTIVHSQGGFKCEVCGENFFNNNNLNKHKLSHPGEKVFKCKACGNSFENSSDLNTHIQTHMKSNMRCEICGIRFTTLEYLTRHRVAHSREEGHKRETSANDFTELRHSLSNTAEKTYKNIPPVLPEHENFFSLIQANIKSEPVGDDNIDPLCHFPITNATKSSHVRPKQEGIVLNLKTVGVI